MQTAQKHTTTQKRSAKQVLEQENVIYITKTETVATKPLFDKKLKKVNKLLGKTILLKK